MTNNRDVLTKTMRGAATKQILNLTKFDNEKKWAFWEEFIGQA